MAPVSEGRRRKLQCTTTVDRISNLPPELIGKILSLLPTTKEAVATSVLSSRWKSFWTFITRLKCDDRSPDFRKPSFISFMYTFLFCKTTSLDYLSVTCRKKANILHLMAWVSAALLMEVKELDLDISDSTEVFPFHLFSCNKNLAKLIIRGDFKVDVPATVFLPNLGVLVLTRVGFLHDDSLKTLILGCPALEQLEISPFGLETSLHLPQELFSYRNLATLELSNQILMNVPAVVSLPSMQALHLDYVKFPDDDSAKRLICGCPSLKQLKIEKGDLEVLHVDAPTLSNLTLSLSGDEKLIVLETPSLRYLEVKGVSVASYELTDLNHLVEANLQDMYCAKDEAVANLITGISNVKTLTLSGYVMEAIVKSRCELPKFHSLNTLKLGKSNDAGWALLHDFLENSPFLEMLVFQIGLGAYSSGCKGQDSSEIVTWHPPQKVPYCLLHHLKVIQIDRFDGDIEGEEMIKYFIENRGALKDLTIQYSRGSGKIWDINVADD